MLLGCIGDDFTGSSDLANTLAKGGMQTVQYTGVPETPAAAEVQAGVVALKSRSVDPSEAVAQSLAALDWLQAQGCQQIFFKYCSTFDSTAQGNIGPVAEALADKLGAEKVIFCPAFPGTGRSVYQGHLFVRDMLLNQSGMENHPLTPMTDPDIRRCLAAQTRNQVGHIPADVVFQGETAIEQAIEAAPEQHLVVDAIRDTDLVEIGKAAKHLPLVTGGSGVALGLPANFGCTPASAAWQGQRGRAVALSGSCSTATRAQVARHIAHHPGREISAADIIDGSLSIDDVASWAMTQPGLPLVYSSADPAVVTAVQNRFGREASSGAIETFFGDLARTLAEQGVTRLISAGGETSGAVVETLAPDTLAIGPEIDPGVPALRASDNLVLALKSGNFGAVDFFEKAGRVLAGEDA
jgi:uncharacterized protein YgbK (DUF1537 family)